MMALDIQYVERKSLGLDMKILAGTLPAILRQCWDLLEEKRAAWTAGPRVLRPPPPRNFPYHRL
jgi:hypothetical protein